MKTERLGALGLVSLVGCTLALDFDRAQLSARVDGAPADQTSTEAATDAARDAAPEATTDDVSAGCPAGRGDCDGSATNGCETDLTSDRMHCAACGRACTGANVCNAGVCGRDCAAPMTACGMQCVDTRSDAHHCGGCGITCGMGSTRCCLGVCQMRCG